MNDDHKYSDAARHLLDAAVRWATIRDVAGYHSIACEHDLIKIALHDLHRAAHRYSEQVSKPAKANELTTLRRTVKEVVQEYERAEQDGGCVGVERVRSVAQAFLRETSPADPHDAAAVSSPTEELEEIEDDLFDLLVDAPATEAHRRFEGSLHGLPDESLLAMAAERLESVHNAFSSHSTYGVGIGGSDHSDMASKHAEVEVIRSRIGADRFDSEIRAARLQRRRSQRNTGAPGRREPRSTP